MMTRLGGAAGVAVVALAASCRLAGPPPVVDPALANCLSSDTLAVAGVNLGLVRASALYGRLGPAAAAFLEPYREADYALFAYNGKDVLAVARGTFRAAPPGAVLLAKGCARGTAEAVRAAAAQRKTGASGAQWLLDRGAEAGRFGQIWAVARGEGALAFPGNAANLSRLLSLTEYATLAAKFTGSIQSCGLPGWRATPPAPSGSKRACAGLSHWRFWRRGATPRWPRRCAPLS